jgi:hypothetical protein
MHSNHPSQAAQTASPSRSSPAVVALVPLTQDGAAKQGSEFRVDRADSITDPGGQYSNLRVRGSGRAGFLGAGVPVRELVAAAGRDLGRVHVPAPRAYQLGSCPQRSLWPRDMARNSRASKSMRLLRCWKSRAFTPRRSAPKWASGPCGTGSSCPPSAPVTAGLAAVWSRALLAASRPRPAKPSIPCWPRGHSPRRVPGLAPAGIAERGLDFPLQQFGRAAGDDEVLCVPDEMDLVLPGGAAVRREAAAQEPLQSGSPGRVWHALIVASTG